MINLKKIGTFIITTSEIRRLCRPCSSSLQASLPADDVCLHEDAGDSGSPRFPVHGRHLGKGFAA